MIDCSLRMKLTISNMQFIIDTLAQRDCMAARIASINKDREHLRARLSDEKVATSEYKAKLDRLLDEVQSAKGSIEDSNSLEPSSMSMASQFASSDDVCEEEDLDLDSLDEDADTSRLRSLLQDRQLKHKMILNENKDLRGKLLEQNARMEKRAQKSERDFDDYRIRMASLDSECRRLREELTSMTLRAEANESLVGEAMASVTAAIEDAKTLNAKPIKSVTETKSSSMTPAKAVDAGVDPKTPTTSTAESTREESFDVQEVTNTPLHRRQVMLLTSPLLSTSCRKNFSATDPYGLGEASYEYKTSSDFDEDRRRWMEVLQENFQSPGTAKLGRELLMEEHYFESLAFEKSLQQQEEEEKLREQVRTLQAKLEHYEAIITQKEQAESLLMLDDDLLEDDLNESFLPETKNTEKVCVNKTIGLDKTRRPLKHLNKNTFVGVM